MTNALGIAAASRRLDEALAERGEANRAFFEAEAERLARVCHRMAERFARGGRLVALGITPAARSDVRHVAVEFVHPVIVGKRALPAISLTTDVATVTGVAEQDGMAGIFAHQLRYLAAPEDIALGISADGDNDSVRAGLATARERGLLTVALAGRDGGAIARDRVAEHVLIAPASDPRIVKELQVTTYHVLWELVHVFFEQPGVLDPEVVA